MYKRDDISYNENRNFLTNACLGINSVNNPDPKSSKISNNFGKRSRRNRCENNNANCDNWAASGQCHANQGYMLKNCKKSCNVCDSRAPSIPITGKHKFHIRLDTFRITVFVLIRRLIQFF